MNQKTNPTDTLISVIICTYNRVDFLAQCLDSLLEQECDNAFFNIVVVDNNSQDSTSQKVREYQKKHHSIDYVLEKKVGLSKARNRGWRESQSKYVAYIDDDAIAARNWLAEMNAFIQKHPEVVAFGGAYSAYPTENIPAWLPENYGSNDHGGAERVLDLRKESLSGTNMVFKRRILRQFNGFCHDLGMQGTSSGYGEETEFVQRLGANGEKVYYLPTLRVKHFLHPQKTKLGWILKESYILGKSTALKFNTEESLIYLLLKFLYRVLRLPFLFVLNSKKPLKLNIVLTLLPVLGVAGQVSNKLFPVKSR